MKFKVLRGFCLGGGKDVYPGQTVIIKEEARQKQLLAAGKIIAFAEDVSAGKDKEK